MLRRKQWRPTAPVTEAYALHVAVSPTSSVAVHTTSRLTPTGSVAVSSQITSAAPLASAPVAPIVWLVPSSTLITDVGHSMSGGVLSAIHERVCLGTGTL